MITTDYFDIVESAVVALLRNTSQFNWTDKIKQVTKSNDVYLDGGFDKFAITYPGAFPQNFAGTDVQEVEWEVLLDVLTRWNTSEDKAWIDFKAYRSLVFNLFTLSYDGRTLGRTPGITKVTLTANDRPRYIPLRKDPESDIVSHIGQVMVLTVTQSINKEY